MALGHPRARSAPLARWTWVALMIAAGGLAGGFAVTSEYQNQVPGRGHRVRHLCQGRLPRLRGLRRPDRARHGRRPVARDRGPARRVHFHQVSDDDPELELGRSEIPGLHPPLRSRTAR
jgi:hypothetical protein